MARLSFTIHFPGVGGDGEAREEEEREEEECQEEFKEDE